MLRVLLMCCGFAQTSETPFEINTPVPTHHRDSFVYRPCSYKPFTPIERQIFVDLKTRKKGEITYIS